MRFRYRFNPSALALFILGGLVICGWVLRDPRPILIASGLKPMALDTAVGFVLLALGLSWNILRWPAALLTFALGAVVLLAYLLNAFGYDQLWNFRPWAQTGEIYDTRMAIVAAISFCVSAFALVRPSMVLGLTLMVVMTMILIGYLFGIQLLNWGGYQPIAPHAGIGFFIFGEAIWHESQ